MRTVPYPKIGNFYGASNDEYSQPRHCWDPSGKYVYSVSLGNYGRSLADVAYNFSSLQTSQDKCIVVWEIRSQSVVARLEGHSETVVSCIFALALSPSPPPALMLHAERVEIH